MKGTVIAVTLIFHDLQVQHSEDTAMRVVYHARLRALVPYAFARWLVRKLDGAAKTGKGKMKQSSETDMKDMSKPEVRDEPMSDLPS